MEATAAGAVTRRDAFCPVVAATLLRVPRSAGSAGSSSVSVRQLGGFADEGHLRYYASPARCGRREEDKKAVKRRAKLAKRLAAVEITDSGPCVEVDPWVAGERKMTLEEARDFLLARLELLNAEEKEMRRREKEEKKAAVRAAAKQMKACDQSEDSEDEEEQMKRDNKMVADCNGCKDSNHKEMKRKKKEEKAAMKAAAGKKKMEDCGECEDSSESSSSSSESSDSDCEVEVMDMNSLITVPANTETVSGEVRTSTDELNLSATVGIIEESARVVDIAFKCDSGCSSSSSVGSNASTSACCSSGSAANGVGSNASTSACCSSGSAANGVGSNASTSACCGSGKGCSPVVIAAEAVAPVERIEVCMGGKCKKSGAMELMQEFQGRVGIEGAVVGCKCMGKCKEGPNVRFRNVQSEGDESMKVVRNPLCIGVGLDDVETIVANFFTERKDMGLLTA